jgi:hypothetical protein
MKLNPYTVVLAFPDYLYFPRNACYARHVASSDPDKALKLVRMLALENTKEFLATEGPDNSHFIGALGSPDEFKLIAVFEGYCTVVEDSCPF